MNKAWATLAECSHTELSIQPAESDLHCNRIASELVESCLSVSVIVCD